MVSIERMNRIMDVLNKRKVIATNQLESLIYCSTSTLRRDLIQLEKDGKIIRSHGEVRLSNSTNIEHTYRSRTYEDLQEKRAIADIASTFITHNMSIFLDSSTTTAALIPYLTEFNNLRVITNGIEAAHLLNPFENVTLFIAGGYIGSGTNSVLGDFATHFLDNFHTDLAFFSCRGLDRFAAYEANYNQALIKQKMIDLTENAILLADHSKFNTSHYFKLTHYDRLNYIITDQEPVESFMSSVSKHCEILW